MSENDEILTPPAPEHVVPGDAPDPVKATEPVAPPAPDEQDLTDEELLEERRPIMPPNGPQGGVILPPTDRVQ